MSRLKKPKYQCDRMRGRTRLPSKPVSVCLERKCPHLLQRGTQLFGADRRVYKRAVAQREADLSSAIVSRELEEKLSNIFGPEKKAEPKEKPEPKKRRRMPF